MTAKNFIKQTVFSYGLLAVVMIMGYVMRIVFAKNLSTYDYGLFYSIIGLFGFLSIFRSLGTNTSMTHFLPKYIKKGNASKIKSLLGSVFVFQLFLGVTISALLFIFSKTIASAYLSMPEAASLIRIQAVTYLVIGFVEFIKSAFSGYQKPALSMLYDALRNTFIVGFSWLALHIGIFSVRTLIIIWLASYALFGLIYFTIFLIENPNLMSVRFRKYDSIIKEVRKYSIPLMLGIAATLILSKTDVVLLTLFKNLEQVAFYEVAFPVASLITSLGMPLGLVLLPLISKNYFEGNRRQIKKTMSLIYNSGVFLILPALFLFLKYSEFIILNMFSAEYLPVVLGARIFMFGTSFGIFNTINLNILSGIGEIKKKTKILYLGAGFNVLLDILLIPLLGYLGAIIVTSLSYVVMTVASFIICRKEIPEFRPKMRPYLKIGANFLIFVALLYVFDLLIPSQTLVKYAVAILVGLVAYFGLGVFFMRIINYKELWRLVKQTLRVDRYGK